MDKVVKALRDLNEAIESCSEDERASIIRCFNEDVDIRHDLTVYYVVDCLGYTMSYEGISLTEMALALEKNNATTS